MKRKRSPSPRHQSAHSVSARPWNSASPPGAASSSTRRRRSHADPLPPSDARSPRTPRRLGDALGDALERRDTDDAHDAGEPLSIGASSSVRKSGRQRKLNYESFNTDWMTDVGMIRYRSDAKAAEEKEEQRGRKEPKGSGSKEKTSRREEEEEEEEDPVKEEGEDEEEADEAPLVNGKSKNRRDNGNFSEGGEEGKEGEGGTRRSRRRAHAQYHESEGDEGEGEEEPHATRSSLRGSPLRTPPSNKSPERRQQKMDDLAISDGGHNLRRRAKDADSYYNHVRFSPSVKPGSPALSNKSGGGGSRHDSSRHLRLRKVRLHNLTSEDEQAEFQRRYSRDLRTRRRKQHRKPVGEDGDSEEDNLDLFSAKDGDNSDDNDKRTRKSTRKLAEMNIRPRISSTEDEDEDEGENGEDAEEEDEHSEGEEGEMNGDDSLNSSNLRRSSRRTLHAAATPKLPSSATNGHRTSSRRSASLRGGLKKDVKDEEEGDEEVEEEILMNDEDNDGDAPRRRSGRIHKQRIPVNDDDDDDDDDDNEGEEEEEQRGRGRRRNQGGRVLVPDDPEEDQTGLRRSSRRSRCPVDRLQYEAPARSTRGGREVRNMDQYSSDEEFHGDSGRGRNRRSRYNMRENRQTIRRFEAEYPMKTSAREDSGRSHNRRDLTYRSSGRDRSSRRNRTSYKDRDTSSSSSPGDNTDEERFQKRKTKRMNIERGKLMPLNLGKDDVNKAVFRDRQKVGASLADVSPMEMDMGVSFDNVGGCASHVNSLKEMVMFPLLYPEIFQKFSINAPRGVLFYGPPGTGKTLIARALACECSRDGKKVAFFMRKGADCLSKWIGESERQLRLLFDQAYQMRPSIIFFDEIDGLAPVRSSRQDQIHSSIVSTLLALMDGLDSRGEVIVIGATNRIENIDPALRRPGRFDRELRFDLPTRDARKEIISLHTKSWNPKLSEELVDKLADKTIGYCGADIKGLCAESALNALRRRYPQVYKSNQKLKLDMDEILIRDQDFFKAMTTMVPSTHRVKDQNQSPLPPAIRPLLSAVVNKICQNVTKIMPAAVALCKGVDTADGSTVAERHSFRPRLLLTGRERQGLTTYIAPAVLHFLEKLPCHKLDIPALYSNSARTPEEALVHILHEAKRTIPSVLYLPHVHRLWRIMSESVRETFLSLLTDVQPSAPLLVLAVMEDSYPKKNPSPEDLPQNLFLEAHGEVVSVENPTSQQRKLYFEPIFLRAQEPVPVAAAEEAKRDEELAVVPVQECRSLTEKEEKRLRKKEEHLLRELRIFLRETWGKINREAKFFMFRTPVDTEEVYDYEELIKNPMDFDTMLCKLDNNEYNTAASFLADIDLIAENAITYNSDPRYETNKIICHRARALQDFCYALVKTEMDTDFEDNCKEIVERRQKLTQKLKETFAENHDEALSTASSRPKKRPAKKRRVSSWAKGCDSSRTRRAAAKKKAEGDEDDDEEEEQEEEEEDEAGEEDVERIVVNGAHNGEVLECGKEASTDSSKANGHAPTEAAINGSSEHSSRKSRSPPTPTRRGRVNNQEHSEPMETTRNGNEEEEVTVDKARLSQLQNEVVRFTDGNPTERLERVYAALSDIVSGYATLNDRSRLTKDIQEKVEELKRSKL